MIKMELYVLVAFVKLVGICASSSVEIKDLDNSMASAVASVIRFYSRQDSVTNLIYSIKGRQQISS